MPRRSRAHRENGKKWGEKNKLINAFDPRWQGAVPFTVLIDPDGKIVYREDGSIDLVAIKRAIVKALDEHEGH